MDERTAFEQDLDELLRDPEARAIFESFLRGLTSPDSPTLQEPRLP